jgi:RNA polymerase sigma-70 factor, ECF subfamily
VGVSEQTDLALIDLSRQGNKAAFGQLVLRYQSMALRLAKRVIGDEDLAQELVQEAMLQAYLSLDKLRDPTRFKNWLYGIVLNVCRNELRRRKVICFSLETLPESLLDEAWLTSENGSDPQQIVEQEEVHGALVQAIDTLSHKNRSATILFYHKQLSLQEVAHHLNISVGAVKGRLHKARHQLREQLSSLQLQTQLHPSQEIQTMTTEASESTKPEFFCSFCKKSSKQIRFLIAGPLLERQNIYICNECVDKCNEIINAEKERIDKIEAEKLIDSDP